MTAMELPRRLYLAGPMRGIEGYNYPAFNRAAANLRERGFTVHNPAESEVWTGEESLKLVINYDLSVIVNWADAVATLPGSKNSVGARAEVAVAEWVGIPIYEAELLLDLTKARNSNV